MDEHAPLWTLGRLAQEIGGEVVGPEDLVIERPVSVETGDPHGISFCESQDYLDIAEASGVGAVLLPRDIVPKKTPAIVVDHPRATFGYVLSLFVKTLPLNVSVHPMAVVDSSVELGEGVSVGPYAVIERGAVVEAGAKVFPFVYIGQDCRVGKKAVLYPHAVLYQDVVVGDNAIVHSGAVLGADGFGFVWDGNRQIKIPHVGGVQIDAEAEIGANTTIDRSMMGTTVVGEGTKIDNLVQIGHNCTIGKHTVMASQVGIAGSCKVGDRCTFAGQAALSDHVTLTDDVIFAGRTATSQDITEPGPYFGAPALPFLEGRRVMIATQKLPEALRRLKRVETEVEKLKGSGDE